MLMNKNYFTLHSFNFKLSLLIHVHMYSKLGPALSGCMWLWTHIIFTVICDHSNMWGSKLRILFSSVTEDIFYLYSLQRPATQVILLASRYKMALGSFQKMRIKGHTSAQGDTHLHKGTHICTNIIGTHICTFTNKKKFSLIKKICLWMEFSGNYFLYTCLDHMQSFIKIVVLVLEK